ncbi:hypothetical protein V6K52_16535 [Knoellia sp. S7-12]|uniref:hypothetical protein n=1 Tax=Knoellia sp. S7-12 TaxID=3126698 RepID=UPI0033674517
MGAEDFQCPEGATPESGLCTSLRRTYILGEEGGTVSGDRKLTVGSADASIEGAWSAGGESTPALMTVDIDVLEPVS